MAVLFSVTVLVKSRLGKSELNQSNLTSIGISSGSDLSFDKATSTCLASVGAFSVMST
jgi:hypothetical protein